uniref:8.9 kDa family member n=1 Tax=Rhipicephalus appendiculatus TaxID=34631 RepID=A0A131YNP4_RHIAP
MEKIVLYFILTSVFVQILESALLNRINNETPRRNWYIVVPVKTHNGQWCKYHNENLKAHSIKYFHDPCECIVCNHNATEVLIKGCPPPENISSSADRRSWPNCCPQWRAKQAEKRRLATKQT